MTKIIILILIIALGLILGPSWASGQGVLVLMTPTHTIEMSLIVAALLLIAALFVLWLFELLFRSLFKGKRSGSRWFRGRKQRKAQKHFNQALHAWLLKDYETAAKLAEAAAPALPQPQDAYLLAATAWQAVHNQSEQQRLLELAQLGDSKDLAVQLALLDNLKDPTKALALAKELLAQAPKNRAVLRTVAISLYHHRHLQTLRGLLTDIDNQQALPRALLAEYTRACYRAYFTSAGTESTKLKESWADLPKKLRRSTPVRLAYLDVLMASGYGGAAAKVAARGIHHHVLTASDLLQYNANDWREVAPLREETEKQIKAHPEHPNWVLLLAILAMQEGDYSLAERAAQQAIRLKGERIAYRTLGDALSASGQADAALNAYRKAAQLK